MPTGDLKLLLLLLFVCLFACHPDLALDTCFGFFANEGDLTSVHEMGFCGNLRDMPHWECSSRFTVK